MSSTTTRTSRTIASSGVKTLVGLSDDQLKVLEDDYGITKLQDLALLDKSDIDSILGNDKATFLVRRRLTRVGDFLRRGGSLSSTTTMGDITIESGPTTATTTTLATKQTALIKLSPTDFPKFSGEIEDQEDFKTTAEAQIGQTAFKFLLTRDATNDEEKERDEELYNVFKNSFYGGKAYMIITQSLKDSSGNPLPASGRRVWQNFLKWCSSGGRQNTLIKSIKDELKALRLDGDTVDGLEYVNQFVVLHDKLEHMQYKVTDVEKLTQFVDHIEDPAFETVQQLLQNYLSEIDRGERTLKMKEFTDMVETRQRGLNRAALDDMEAKSRRQTRRDDEETKSSTGSNLRTALQIPQALFASFSTEQKKAFLKWKNATAKGEKVTNDEIVKLLKKQETSDPSTQGRKRKRGKKSGAMKIRRTGTQNSDTPSEEVQLLMISDEESNDSDSDLDDTDSKKIGAHKVIRKHKPSRRDNNGAFPFHSILDTGTEWTVVGGPAWTILRRYQRRMNMAAVDGSMTSVSMQCCDAITAIQDDRGNVQFLGIRRAAYSPNLTDDEAVINDHLVREAGWTLDCVAERHGGSQCFWLPTGEAVPLAYDSTKYKMYFDCRAPSAEEIASNSVHWISCHIEDLKLEDRVKPVRRDLVQTTPQLLDPSMEEVDDATHAKDQDPESVKKQQIEQPGTTTTNTKATQASDTSTAVADNAAPMEENPTTATAAVDENVGSIDWKETMGLSDETLVQTLKNTTQFFPHRVESENQTYPLQHRQKRLHPLHGRRLRGRTCADTFFSSIKSIRGYTCVQLFVVLFADYLWVKLLRRESQVPGSYTDFCREVGAPNELLTDNSKVQAGRRFIEVDRKNQTSHKFSTPHCQNQNPSERRIQDVKHRAILHLYHSRAPLVFWCYAVTYAVDCLNHLSKRSLSWRTAKGVLSGNTVDISVFRFSFWQPIEYLNPHVKFPGCKWQKGRFVGIAWDHGDPFTYLVWTEPESGGWKKGRELVRNVVRVRSNAEKDPMVTREEYDKLVLKKNTNVLPPTTKKQHKKRPRASDAQNVAPSSKRRGPVVSFDDDVQQIAAPDDDGTIPVDADDTPPLASHSEEQEGDDATTRITSSQDSAVPPNDNDQEEETVEDDPTAPSVQDVENADEINDQFFQPLNEEEQEASLVEINGFRWKEGRLQLRYFLTTEETQWVDYRDAKLDHPRLVAQYIVSHYKPRSKNESRDRVLPWAKKTLRDLERAVRRIARLYDFYLDEDDRVQKVRRVIRAKKKKARGPRTTVFKYGVEVPRNVKHALELDKANGNTMWQDAMALEIKALDDMDCFEFRSSENAPGGDYQLTTLHMVFDCKQDLRRKARLVAGGHLVDLLDNDVYSSTVKGISVKLLHVIAHRAGLEALCGDIGNAYVNAYTTEKVYARAGPEFGEERRGQIVVIRKALYGLATSCARFHDHLSDTLRSMDFSPTRFDRDVWIRANIDGKTYEYICTHVDDFCIFSTKPEEVMYQIQSVYTVKSVGPPEYYLGNDFKRDKQGRWMIGCKKYIREAVVRVERIFGTLKKHDTPSVPGDHPELDDSALLNDQGHQQYQMLVGMLNWIVTLGRIDITHSVSSHARFVACPRVGHKERALYTFGYLKKKPNRRIRIDSRDPKVVKNGAEHKLDEDLAGKLKEHYPDAVETLDERVPDPLCDELAITAYVDSDHAHDKITRRSITGLIIFVGRTPVFYMSKRQGAVETSTYGAEFMAMKTAVEEVMSVRYMLRCLGVRVEKPSRILGDNRSVILNSTVPSSLLKKKHVAISFHMAREATAAQIVQPIKTKGSHNFSDVLTKPQPRKTFAELVHGMMC